LIEAGSPPAEDWVAAVCGTTCVVGAGEPHAVRIMARTRSAGTISKVIPFFLFILPPIDKKASQDTHKNLFEIPPMTLLSQ
jgi:hypothetical protein